MPTDGRLSPSRQRLANVALALAAGGCVLLAAEVALRVTAEHPPVMLKCGKPPLFLDCYPNNPRGSFDVDLRDPATCSRYEALFGRSLAAEAARTPFAVEVRFNSLHFREREIGSRRPGVRRVMVLGDSFTEGQGVRESDTYPRVLERLLLAAQPGRWEVFNCGHRGADFPQLYEAFEEQLLPHDPDVVLYGMVLNDAVQSPEFGARYPLLNDWIAAPRDEPSWWEPRLFGFVSGRLQARRVADESIRWYREMYGEPNRAGWAQTQRLIKRMATRMHDRGGTFQIALWPLLVDLQDRYPFADVHASIAAFCRTAGIPEHDLLPVLREEAAAHLWVHPADRHPNELAHRLAAASLARVLLDPATVD